VLSSKTSRASRSAVSIALLVSLFQAEDGIRDRNVTGVQTCALPISGFMPSTGTVLHLSEPTGPGVRVDSGLRTGSTIGTEFDPMVAKVIATGRDRAESLARLGLALDQMTILGVNTNLEYLQRLIRDPDVVVGNMDTTLVERRLPNMVFDAPTSQHAQMAARLVHTTTQSPAL